jgi:hypothetical protein
MKISLASSVSRKNNQSRNVSDQTDYTDQQQQNALDVK